MIILYEFYSKEAIDNVITCMNYEVDEIVYLCYGDIGERSAKTTVDFLGKYCNVPANRIKFMKLSRKNADRMIDTIRSDVKREMADGNKVFFDVTGGDELILVAFGKLSAELDLPMHSYDMPEGLLREYGGGSDSLSGCATGRYVKHTLDMQMELYGGAINRRLHRSEMSVCAEALRRDVISIYNVYYPNREFWSRLTTILRDNMESDGDMRVSQKVEKIRGLLSTGGEPDPEEFESILTALARKGVIDYEKSDGRYLITYRNETVKTCLTRVGDILELGTLISERDKGYAAEVDAFIDWDGVIHDTGDVFNEVDVISLTGYVPMFISCKNGRLLKESGNKTIDNGYKNALYELETIARRFGGKYAKKVLVTWNDITGAYLERAQEMGIEIREPEPPFSD